MVCIVPDWGRASLSASPDALKSLHLLALMRPCFDVLIPRPTVYDCPKLVLGQMSTLHKVDISGQMSTLHKVDISGQMSTLHKVDISGRMSTLPHGGHFGTDVQLSQNEAPDTEPRYTPASQAYGHRPLISTECCVEFTAGAPLSNGSWGINGRFR